MKKICYLKYTLKYLSDPAIPFYRKIWIYLVLFYFLSPFDLIPEPILGIGFVDDAVIIIFSIIKLLDILENYANQAEKNPEFKDGATIDKVEYKVHEE